MIALVYDIRLNVMRTTVGEGFDPVTGNVNRRFSGLNYWVKGFLSGGPFQIALNVWHVIYALGSWVLAGFGLYAAIEGKRPHNRVLKEVLMQCRATGMILAFENPQLNAFSCTSPLNLNA
jgi:hypothetical protein